MPRYKPVRTNVIGIDPGTMCGYSWMVALDGELYLMESGVWDLSRKRHEGGGMQMVRLVAYFEQLCQHIFDDDPRGDSYRWHPGHLAYELIRFHGPKAGVDAPQFYGAVVARIQEECERRDMPYIGYAPSTVRKQALGSGKLKKPQVKRGLEQIFGKYKDVKTFDRTDAIATALAHVKMLGLWEE